MPRRFPVENSAAMGAATTAKRASNVSGYRQGNLKTQTATTAKRASNRENSLCSDTVKTPRRRQSAPQTYFAPYEVYPPKNPRRRQSAPQTCLTSNVISDTRTRDDGKARLKLFWRALLGVGASAATTAKRASNWFEQTNIDGAHYRDDGKARLKLTSEFRSEELQDHRDDGKARLKRGDRDASRARASPATTAKRASNLYTTVKNRMKDSPATTAKRASNPNSRSKRIFRA